MADGFGEFDGPPASVQGAVADFHVAEFLAGGAGLRFVEQLCLLDREIFHNTADYGLSDFASGVFNAGKGGLYPSELGGFQIHADFLSDFFHGLLIFG